MAFFIKLVARQRTKVFILQNMKFGIFADGTNIAYKYMLVAKFVCTPPIYCLRRTTNISLYQNNSDGYVRYFQYIFKYIQICFDLFKCVKYIYQIYIQKNILPKDACADSQTAHLFTKIFQILKLKTRG